MTMNFAATMRMPDREPPGYADWSDIAGVFEPRGRLDRCTCDSASRSALARCPCLQCPE